MLQGHWVSKYMMNAMNTNPIYQQAREAFAPFFTDRVEWVDSTGTRHLFCCCKFPVDDAALLMDNSLQTDVKLTNILIAGCDTKANRPDVGDILVDCDGVRYAVMSVEWECTWTKLTAREVAEDD